MIGILIIVTLIIVFGVLPLIIKFIHKSAGIKDEYDILIDKLILDAEKKLKNDQLSLAIRSLDRAHTISLLHRKKLPDKFYDVKNKLLVKKSK